MINWHGSCINALDDFSSNLHLLGIPTARQALFDRTTLCIEVIEEREPLKNTCVENLFEIVRSIALQPPLTRLSVAPLHSDLSSPRS
jgi:hypothetical protein